MASLARTFASTLSKRTYNTVPASAPAMKRFFSVATNNKDEEQKERSASGLLNRSNVNGMDIFSRFSIF
jgi:hypothetical protein